MGTWIGHVFPGSALILWGLVYIWQWITATALIIPTTITLSAQSPDKDIEEYPSQSIQEHTLNNNNDNNNTRAHYILHYIPKHERRLAIFKIGIAIIGSLMEILPEIKSEGLHDIVRGAHYIHLQAFLVLMLFGATELVFKLSPADFHANVMATPPRLITSFYCGIVGVMFVMHEQPSEGETLLHQILSNVMFLSSVFTAVDQLATLLLSYASCKEGGPSSNLSLYIGLKSVTLFLNSFGLLWSGLWWWTIAQAVYSNDRWSNELLEGHALMGKHSHAYSLVMASGLVLTLSLLHKCVLALVKRGYLRRFFEPSIFLASRTEFEPVLYNEVSSEMKEVVQGRVSK